MSIEPTIAHRLVESHRSYAHAIAGEILRKLPSHVEKDDIQAAAELGISEVTLQIHRRNVMHKMAAASLADLVRIAERLQVPVTHSRLGGADRYH